MFRVEKYHAETATPAEDLKRPPGLYKCPECRDTTIIWRTAVDKYKVKCTKCNADMVRIKLIPKPAPLVPTSGIQSDYGLKAWWSKRRENADSRAITEIQAGLGTVTAKRAQRIRDAKANRTIPNTRRLDRDIDLFNNILAGYKKAGKQFSHNELDGLAEQYGVGPIAAALVGGIGASVGVGVMGHRRAMKERVGLKKPIGPVGHVARLSALGVPYYVGRGIGMKKKKIPEKWLKKAKEAGVKKNELDELAELAEQYGVLDNLQTSQLLRFAKARKGLSKNDSLKLDKAIEASSATNRKGSKAADLWKVANQTFPGKFPSSDPHYKLDELAEIYGSDPQRAQLEAARAGVPICEVAFHYGKGTVLTGLELGAKHGKEEAAGTRGAPGALKLWLLQKLHGGSYVIGRQKGLSGKHGGTRSGESIVDALPALLKGLVSGQAQA